jgi:hypothetical protein
VLLGGRHGQVEGPLGFNGGAIGDTQMVLRSGRTGELFESSSARVQKRCVLGGPEELKRPRATGQGGFENGLTAVTTD